MKLGDYYVLDEKRQLQFERFIELLLEWNKKMNLTAITERDDIILKHLIDSLTIYKYIKKDSKIIDVGTGAGFPGIPLKIYDESIKITLMDSLKKRINFLNTVVEELKLNNINLIHGRAEDIGREKMHRERYDFAVSRAVASLPVLLEYMLPFVKIDGKCICMKGANVDEEIHNCKYALKKLGGEIDDIIEFYLPNTEIKRSIVIIKKIKNTSKEYPRRAGIPSKNPLIKID